jgi:hypothetical protein
MNLFVFEQVYLVILFMGAVFKSCIGAGTSLIDSPPSLAQTSVGEKEAIDKGEGQGC